MKDWLKLTLAGQPNDAIVWIRGDLVRAVQQAVGVAQGSLVFQEDSDVGFFVKETPEEILNVLWTQKIK